MTPRSEPLLWLQLIGFGVLPLEALLLLLVLAGSDPGPLPGLERLLCWAIGALAPALLLVRRPADVWSLLLLQTPLKGRRELQRRLSRLQATPVLGLATAGGAALDLPLLWWIDRQAAVASPFSPFSTCPRLVALLLAALLLAVMLWQWQQLLQSVWLLSRKPETVAKTAPLSLAELEQQRLCLGLPLLLPEPLKLPEPSAVVPVAVEPQQRTEETEGADLDQQVP
ncbi:MAG: low-complexity tail membrane protein [Aphanothece saxicola GSE-SYN-MK-01-06B]|nr:low-complexity tail membrane protein [Aphanothece saxicola GSE-SYN-MK-01-06B]